MHKVLAGHSYLAGPSKLIGAEGSAARRPLPSLQEPPKMKSMLQGLPKSSKTPPKCEEGFLSSLKKGGKASIG